MAALNSPLDYHESLAKIAKGITQLVTEPRGNAPPFPQQYWMELYTLVFKICSNTDDPRPRDLYADVSALLVRHCQGFRQMLERLRPQDLLTAYLRTFDRFFTGMQNVAAIMNYLNRWWIQSQSALPDFDAFATGVYPVELLPYVIWYDELYTPLREGIFGAMMECVARTRQEATFVRGRPLLAAHEATFTQLRSVVDSYLKIDENLRELPKPADGVKPRIHSLYTAFEEGFLTDSVAHYTRRGRELAGTEHTTAVCVEFNLAVERLLQQEARSTEKWVPAACLAKTTECCLIALVYEHRQLLHLAIPTLLRADKQDDLRRLYRLIKPVQGMPPLLDALQRHVEQSGVDLLRRLDVASAKGRGREGGSAAVKDSRGYAQGLWRLHSRSQGIVSYCCEGDAQCAAAVGGALRTVVNSAPRSAEALARFVNAAISPDRKSSSSSSKRQEAEVAEGDTSTAGEDTIDDGSGSRIGSTFSAQSSQASDSVKSALAQLKMAGDLIKYIDDKDVFMHFTSRLMAKRLIQGTSASLELEEALLRILRPTCGHDFASRLQRMCTDCKLVTDLSARFAEWREVHYRPVATTRTKDKATYANPMVLAASDAQSDDEAEIVEFDDDMVVPLGEDSASAGGIGMDEDEGEGVEVETAVVLPPVDETVGFELLCLTAGSWPVGAQAPPLAPPLAAPAAAGLQSIGSPRTPASAAAAAAAAADQLVDDAAALSSGFMLPTPLERWRCAFEKFYTDSYSGRKLTWLNHLSKVELSFPCGTAENPLRTVDLIGTPQQAAVLVLFNDTGAPENAPPSPMVLGMVCRRLGLTRAEGSALVASLVVSKVLHPPGERRGGGAQGRGKTERGPGDYDTESLLALRAGFGVKSKTKTRSRIKLTTVESAQQQLRKVASLAPKDSSGSGTASRGKRSSVGSSVWPSSGGGSAGKSDPFGQDVGGGDADESLFEGGGSPTMGGALRGRPGSAGPDAGVGSSLQEERKQVLQAAIVRVLKTKKT